MAAEAFGDGGDDGTPVGDVGPEGFPEVEAEQTELAEASLEDSTEDGLVLSGGIMAEIAAGHDFAQEPLTSTGVGGTEHVGGVEVEDMGQEPHEGCGSMVETERTEEWGDLLAITVGGMAQEEIVVAELAQTYAATEEMALDVGQLHDKGEGDGGDTEAFGNWGGAGNLVLEPALQSSVGKGVVVA